ncbi:MAG TPA: glycosyltransferase family 87 protein [Caulobacteraceae bacterium]|nr:glycosyltransferase family 87 protein [Caulobacteraceae bacterium]
MTLSPPLGPAEAPAASDALIARLKRIGVVWALVAAAVYLLDLAHQIRVGLTNGAGRPLGDDFINYWTGGRLALTGSAGDVYDGPAYHAFQQHLVHGTIQAYHFSYPPVALLLLAPLGLIPYAPALVAWLAASAVAYWRTVRSVAGRSALLLALATPALFINAVGGQNGAWSAALLGGGLCLLDRRPWIAGGLFGLLIYKPHLGPLIPLALLAGRRWKPLASAALTAGGLIALSVLVFGVQSWADYAHNLGVMRRLELEDGSGVWQRMVSVFVMARRLGAPVMLAYGLQALSALCAAGLAAWLWLKDAPAPRRCAGLILGACLATPYLQDYDLVMLTFAAAWIAAPGLAGPVRDKAALAAAGLLMIAPLVAAPLGRATGLSLGVLLLLPAVAVVVRGPQPGNASANSVLAVA